MSVVTIDINALRWVDYSSGHFQTVPDPPRSNKTKADLLRELVEAKEDIQAAVDRVESEHAVKVAELVKRETETKREFDLVKAQLTSALAEQAKLNGIIAGLRRDLAGIGNQPSDGGRFMLLELE